MTKTLGKLLGALSNKVAKEVDFEAQPEPFDWIEIGALAWQVVNFEVVQIQSLSFVRTGVVNDEQSTFGVQRGNLFCQEIEVILEDIGIDSIKIIVQHSPLAGHTTPMTLARIWSPR